MTDHDTPISDAMMPDDPARGRYCWWRESGMDRGSVWLLEDKLTAAEAKLEAEKADHWKTTTSLYESNCTMRDLIAERDALRERLESEIAKTGTLYHDRDAAVADLAVMRERAEKAEAELNSRFPADEYYTNLNDALAQRDEWERRAWSARGQCDADFAALGEARASRDALAAECERMRGHLQGIVNEWPEPRTTKIQESPWVWVCDKLDAARAALALPAAEGGAEGGT